MKGLRALAVGNRLNRWQNDESKIAGCPVEIRFWDDNSFYLLCDSELGMYRIVEKRRRLEYVLGCK